MMREGEQVAARLQTERGPSAATLKALDGAGRRCCMKALRGWGGVARTSLDPPQEPHCRDEVEGPSPGTRQSYRVANWAGYNRALVRRGDVTVWLSAEAIAAWTPGRSGRRGGQRRYSDLAIETALTLRFLYHLPLRQAEGLLHALFGMMRLDLSAPDYTTLSRRSQHLRRRLRPIPTRLAEAHVQQLVHEFVEQYHHESNHQGRDNQLLQRPPPPVNPDADVERRERLGGTSQLLLPRGRTRARLIICTLRGGRRCQSSPSARYVCRSGHREVNGAANSRRCPLPVVSVNWWKSRKRVIIRRGDRAYAACFIPSMS